MPTRSEIARVKSHVVSRLGAVAVHACEQNFPGAVLFHSLRPFTGIDPGRISAAVGKDLPVIADALGVDGDDDALAAEHFRRLADEFRTINRAGIDRNFVGARFEESANIFSFVNAAANRQRHKNLLGGSGHDVENDAAVFMGSGDVEETELVRAFAIVIRATSHRIAGVPETRETLPL